MKVETWLPILTLLLGWGLAQVTEVLKDRLADTYYGGGCRHGRGYQALYEVPRGQARHPVLPACIE
jgi:hypothetical protein